MGVSTRDGYGLMIDKLLYTYNGQLTMSVLFGLAIAFIIRPVCKNNCRLYQAPDMEDIQGKTFDVDGTCYNYTAIPCECTENALE